MAPNDDAPRFRAHAQMLREATRGFGKDIELELRDAEKEIARLPKTAGREYDDLRVSIELKLARLSIKAHKFRKEFPKEVKTDVRKAGHAVRAGAQATAVRTARAGKNAEKKAKRGLARAAGVYHDPLEEWQHSS